ncbi:hypothetical protein LN050_10745 [Comamonadaceae bacterium M7527]|nr:hypothetical protein LN050_10745 [Comamonadaceae bacterium M7527]
MIIARLIMFALLGTCVLSFVMYALTANAGYKRFGLMVLKWTVFAGLAFFAILFATQLLS